MGLPIDRLVIATNRNDILHRAISTGRYDMDTVFPTITPSMDIQVSSNFERALFYAYDRDGGAVAQLMGEMKQGGFGISQGALGVLRSHFDSGCSAEEATSATMKTMFETTGEVLCPHSAVGVKVALDHLGGSPMITLATAHPAKFPDAVEAAMGVRPVLPRWLADLFDLPERLTEMPNDLQHMKSLIRERIAL
jgi:threonine synthase